MKKSSFAIGVAAAALAMVAAVSGASAQSWTDSVTIGGRMYMDVSSSSLEVNGAKQGPKSGTGFDVKRVYFQVDKKFNDIYSLQMQTDVSSISGVGNSLYLKKAYFKAAFNPAFEVSVGANEMPWIPYAESIYGYRWLENTLLEQNNTGARTTFGTSADWGLHANGKFAQNFAYQVSVVNGKGYRDSSRSEGMDVEGRVSAKFDQWNFALGGYTGKRGQQAYGNAVVVTPAVGSTPAVYAESKINAHTASRFNALAAYTGDRLRVGGEYFTATDWQTSSILDTSAAHTLADKADGYSAFASYRITPMYTVFGRYDNVKPQKTLKPWNEGKYYNVGLQMSPLKGITLALVAKHDTMDEYSGNATTQGAKKTTEFNEIGIFTELRY